MTPADETLLAALPHRPPFRFLTDGIVLRPGVDGAADWKLSGEEAFFAGHFPGRPMIPGVLIAEALAQLSGLVVFGDDGAERPAHQGDKEAPARLAHVDVRFPGSASPPVRLHLRSALIRSLGALRLFEVEARAEETTVARGQLTLVLGDASKTEGGV